MVDDVSESARLLHLGRDGLTAFNLNTTPSLKSRAVFAGTSIVDHFSCSSFPDLELNGTVSSSDILPPLSPSKQSGTSRSEDHSNEHITNVRGEDVPIPLLCRTTYASDRSPARVLHAPFSLDSLRLDTVRRWEKTGTFNSEGDPWRLTGNDLGVFHEDLVDVTRRCPAFSLPAFMHLEYSKFEAI